MVRIVFLLFVFSGSVILQAQDNALIYNKILKGFPVSFKPFDEGNGYAVHKQLWTEASLFDVIDLGVWEENIQTTPNSTEQIYSSCVVVYDSSFQVVNVLYSNIPVLLNMMPRADNSLILNFNKTAGESNTPVFPIVPNLSYYPTESYGQSIFLHYYPASDSVVGLMNFSAPIGFNEPYFGFLSAAGNLHVLNGGAFNTRVSTLYNDSIIVAYMTLYNEQYLNDISYTNYGEQFNLIRAEYNLYTDEISSTQIGSSTGSQVPLVVMTTNNSSSLYRTGIVRGNNTPVSVSGAEVEMSANDSLYHVYITKETISGETQWLTRLYAYNNINSDTASYELKANDFRVANPFYSIIGKNEYLFVSNRVSAALQIGDTLTYTNFLQDETSYYDPLDAHEGLSSSFYYPYMESRIFKIDETDGSVVGKLSFINTGSPSFTLIASYAQPDLLIELGDKMAWVTYYNVQSDTTAKFTYLSSDGLEQNTYIDLPEGVGSLILWIDEELSVIDHWLIPCACDNYNCIKINAITHYGGDTLLIQGGLMTGATTDLNPFAETEEISTNTWSEFYAFYTAPEILSGTSRAKKQHAFKLFPNPTSGELRLSGLGANTARYTIYDLSGRALRQGTVSENEIIYVGELSSGMYILSAEYDGGGGTVKFIVE